MRFSIKGFSKVQDDRQHAQYHQWCCEAVGVWLEPSPTIRENVGVPQSCQHYDLVVESVMYVMICFTHLYFRNKALYEIRVGKSVENCLEFIGSEHQYYALEVVTPKVSHQGYRSIGFSLISSYSFVEITDIIICNQFQVPMEHGRATEELAPYCLPLINY